MPTTTDYLNQLEQDREDLVDNLETSFGGEFTTEMTVINIKASVPEKMTKELRRSSETIKQQ